MKRLLPILILLLAQTAFASTTMYVDFSWGGTVSSACTATQPCNSWTNVWANINNAYSSTPTYTFPITVYVSATVGGSTTPASTSSQLYLASCNQGSSNLSPPGTVTPTGCFATSNPATNVVFDGISLRNSVTSPGTPNWVSNLGSMTLVPCTDFDLEGSSPPVATCTYNLVPKAVITGTTPVAGISGSGANDYQQCIYGFTVQGFSLQGNEGQGAGIGYIGNLIFQYNEVTRIAKGTYGPGVNPGPGENGPCHTGAARPNGVDSGPDNVTVQYNYIHAEFGECIYVGASTPDPFSEYDSGSTHQCLPSSAGSCQQVEGGSANLNLSCGNGCTSNVGDGTGPTGYCGVTHSKPSTCSTGQNYVIRGNTIESCAAWGGQGDGTDVKDGHVNLQVLGNVYHTSKTPACATNGVCSGSFCRHNGVSTGQSCSVNSDCNCSNLACFGGSGNGTTTGPGVSCTVANQASVCTGGGRCGAGSDGQAPLFESGAVVEGNYVEAPGHQGSPIYASWNNSTGRGDMQLTNNIYTNIESNTGSNNAFEVWQVNTPGTGSCAFPSQTCQASWTTVEAYNNTVYNVASGDGGDCLGNQSGAVSSSATAKNNICLDITPITSFTGASGTLTFAAINTLNAGTSMYLSGFTSPNTGLNGQTVTVSSTGLSGTQFEASVTGSGYSGSGATGTAARAGMIVGTWTRDYNDVTGNTETHGISGNPLFISTTLPASAATNFQLQAGSPALTAGTNPCTLGVNTDYLGNSRTCASNSEMGAFTQASQASPPTCTLNCAGNYSNEPISVTFANPNSGVTLMCVTTDGSTPVVAVNALSCTNGSSIGSGSTGTFSVVAAETVTVVAGTSTQSNSTALTEGYTLTAATPQFSPPGASYAGTQTVTITSTTPSAIHYIFTAGGKTTPTCGSTLYTGPVTISQTGTLAAIACAAGFTPSAVASAGYCIGSGCLTFVNSGFSQFITLTGPSNAPTFSVAANATGDAALLELYCHPSSGTVTSITLTAPGWSSPANIYQLVALTNNGSSGYSSLFGLVAPNASSATFTATFNGVANCTNFGAAWGMEVTGNNTTGGATTFPSSGSSAGASGGCNQTAANITPTSNNNFLGYFCFGASGITSTIQQPWLAGPASGNNYSEQQVLIGGSGSAESPNFTGSTGLYTVAGGVIAPLSAIAAPTNLTIFVIGP